MAGGSTAHGFIAPNVTVTVAGMYGPGREPSFTPTPDGVSTASTSGKSPDDSRFGRAGSSGASPSRPRAEASAAGMPRSEPWMPMPVIASMIRCDFLATAMAVCNRSPASPAENPDAQPGISAAGSSTSTLPPARTSAANPASCNDRPTAMAVTFAPSWASAADANRPSPPLSPAPASSTIDVSSSARSSSSSIPAAMWAAAWAAMRISGTPLSSRGRSMARTVSES